jgi:hypothetical protein
MGLELLRTLAQLLRKVVLLTTVIGLGIEAV